MKKLMLLICMIFVSIFALTGCSKENTIIVGATPSPHAEILNSKAVQDYVKSKGYTLEVIVYQDYVTPNKALNDGGLDANYFQHIPYMNLEIAEKGYNILAAAKVHYEPLNMYGKEDTDAWEGKTIYIINDISNVERALALLLANGLIEAFNMDGFNTQHPMNNITSNKVTVECIDAGLLSKKVDEGSYAVIPGNYALTAWGASKATSLKLFGETKEVSWEKANIIACRQDNKDSEKIKVLIEALSQPAVEEFIKEKYGPTVVFSFEDLLK